MRDAMKHARTTTLLTAAVLIGAGPLAFADQATPPPTQQAPPAADAKPSGKATIVGRWTLTVEVDQSGGPASLDLKLTDKKVSGIISGPNGELPVAGDYTDGKLTFAATIQSQQGNLTITFTGALKDDDTMTGTMDFGQGAVNWKAVRVKDGK